MLLIIYFLLVYHILKEKLTFNPEIIRIMHFLFFFKRENYGNEITLCLIYFFIKKLEN